MRRISIALAAVLVAATAFGCTKTDTTTTGAPQATSATPGSTTGTTDHPPGTTAEPAKPPGTTKGTTKGTTAKRAQDPELEGSLITQDDLPPGTWKKQPLATSGGADMLTVPACQALIPDDAEVQDEASAKIKFATGSGATGIEIENEIERFPSTAAPEAQIALIADPKFASCMQAFFEQQATEESSVKLTGAVTVAPLPVTQTAADLGVDAVQGATVVLPLTSSGNQFDLHLDIVLLQKGNLVGSVSVTHAAPAGGQVTPVDLTSVITAAGQNLGSVTN